MLKLRSRKDRNGRIFFKMAQKFGSFAFAESDLDFFFFSLQFFIHVPGCKAILRSSILDFILFFAFSFTFSFFSYIPFICFPYFPLFVLFLHLKFCSQLIKSTIYHEVTRLLQMGKKLISQLG